MEDVADSFSDLLALLNPFIQSEPHVSLTVEGGLIAEWKGSQASLELQIDPENEAMVYFLDRASNAESEMTVSRCEDLDKWLWSASSKV
jgi:hypothetical protein